MTPAIKPQVKKILKEILNFSKRKKTNLYIVGGYLRDLLFGREKKSPDIDFSLQSGSINFARLLSRRIKAGFVVLDREHASCRLVKKIQGKIYTFDFTDFRSKNLERDLLHRDFTLNAMAIGLEDFIYAKNWSSLLIDPYHGRRDLEKKLLRLVNPKSFDEDPLRIMRAFSLAATFGFKLSPAIPKLIRAKKDMLGNVSLERIRDELFKILDSADSYKFATELDGLRVLKVIFPEFEKMRGMEQGPYHHLDIWKHSLETLRQLEVVYGQLGRNEEIRNYLDQPLSCGRRRYSLLKLAALLHDVGKPGARRRRRGKLIFHGHERLGAVITRTIARRLRLSNDELQALESMVFWHLRPGYLGDFVAPSAKAKFRYFRDTGDEAVSVLILSLADQHATRGRLTTDKSRRQHERVVGGLIKEYFRSQKQVKVPRLINGDDLIKKFKLQPSPLIGKILSQVEELQAIGSIKNKTEALAVAKKMIK